MSGGQAIHKGWRLRNSGTSTWGSGYSLAFISGDRMGAPAVVDVPATGPNGTADIYVDMTAPTTPGTYRGNWLLRNAQDTSFGPTISVIVTIPNQQQPSGKDLSVDVVNVNYPASVAPGQQFRPEVTVRVTSGQLLESRGDMLRFSGGTNYSGFPHIAVVGTVGAGQDYTFRFYSEHPMVAPSSPGTYESRWRVWANGDWAGPDLVLRFVVSAGGSSLPANTPTLTRPASPTPTVAPLPARSSPSPTAKPPSKACTSTTQRVTFPRGGTSAAYDLDLSDGCTRIYVLRINAGQVLLVDVDPWGTTTVTVTDPARREILPPIDPYERVTPYKASTTGDYTVTVFGQEQVTLTLAVPPKTAPAPTPKPPSKACTSTTQRVTFAPGGTSALYTVDLPNGCSRSYTLRINSGQVLHVGVSPWDTVEVTVTNPAKKALAPVDYSMGWRSYNASTAGDYTVSLLGSGQVMLEIVVPPKTAPAPTPKPPSSGCTSTTQRVTFAKGGTSYKVVATLSAGCAKSYILRIMAGQNLVLAIGGYDNAGLDSITVTNPAGKALTADAAAGSRYYAAATTGDYKITVRGAGRVEFDISVPPR